MLWASAIWIVEERPRDLLASVWEMALDPFFSKLGSLLQGLRSLLLVRGGKGLFFGDDGLKQCEPVISLPNADIATGHGLEGFGSAGTPVESFGHGLLTGEKVRDGQLGGSASSGCCGRPDLFPLVSMKAEEIDGTSESSFRFEVPSPAYIHLEGSSSALSVVVEGVDGESLAGKVARDGEEPLRGVSQTMEETLSPSVVVGKVSAAPPSPPYELGMLFEEGGVIGYAEPALLEPSQVDCVGQVEAEAGELAKRVEVSSMTEKQGGVVSGEVLAVQNFELGSALISAPKDDAKLGRSSKGDDSGWVLSMVSSFRQLVGVSCEGHEEELLSLFVALEKERNQNCSINSTKSGGKCLRELKGLNSSVNYEGKTYVLRKSRQGGRDQQKSL